jgi:hypothetical protein
LLGIVPFDAAVVRSGIQGSSILALDGTPAFQAIEKISRYITSRKGGKS